MLKFIENMKARKVRNLVVKAYSCERRNGAVDEFYKMALLKSGIGSGRVGSRNAHMRLARYAGIASDYGFAKQGISLYCEAMNEAFYRREHEAALEYAANAACLAEDAADLGRAARIMADVAKKLERCNEPVLALEAYSAAARFAYASKDYAEALRCALEHYRMSNANGYVGTGVSEHEGRLRIEETEIDPPLSEEEIAHAKNSLALHASR